MTDSVTSLGGVDVSRETIEKLEQFSALIQKWTKSINLVAPRSIPDLWTRHIIDSAQLLHIAPQTWNHWVDIGSGGGLPAIVVAIMDSQGRPMTLIESDQRKCLFLKTVRRELGLNIEIINCRIADATVEPASILSARALAPLGELLEISGKLLDPKGVALFPKGVSYQEEIDHASQEWQFDLRAHISQTNPDSRILELSRIRRRES